MILVSYRSTLTGAFVTLRFTDEAEARQSLHAVGVYSFHVMSAAGWRAA